MRSLATINCARIKLGTGEDGKLDATTRNPDLDVLRDDVQILKGIIMSAVVSSFVDVGCDFEFYVKSQ